MFETIEVLEEISVPNVNIGQGWGLEIDILCLPMLNPVVKIPHFCLVVLGKILFGGLVNGF